ncbi:MAG TPA: alpha-1,4-glucan--maltose-1-phosphate maltosyltransferase [Thermoanaerobaculia bacterium]|jgi:starch synthase (maltosyl-transferring)|nr:alpha-1,4-glucan--maltose-1-phosphate maltosyltransferase [Thermoanaerobaculia bacterium]
MRLAPFATVAVRVEQDGRRRVIIEAASPEVDGGAFPAKRVLGDSVTAEADIFADGHDLISAVLRHRHDSEPEWREVRMRPLANDRWTAEFPVEQLGFHRFTIEAWIDHFLTWHRDLKKRVDGDASEEELRVQMLIGLEHLRAAAARAGARDRRKLATFIATLEGDDPLEEKIEDAWSEDLLALMWRNAERKFVSRYSRELLIEVDRPRAACSAWYELFPRSASAEEGRHGTFRDVEAQLPRVARMGFDVLYVPPIHPIGDTFRKGKNNKVRAESADVGSPWAIGGVEGGHKATHPELGTIDDFERLVKKAREHGLEMAMDIAFQSSPDHPYVKEHPSWFQMRPDGMIQYAENPPKKYQDIYPFNFESDQWQELWAELRDVFAFWIGKGVRVFRVDNPHTKPLPFWEWCIRDLKREWPELIFLAEAFTRPKIMYRLAKAGFTQSYTYFAWRHTKQELTEYFEEISKPPVSDFFRPNAWPNTPDILTEYLQYGGRSAFVQRFVLAATLCSNYGIYGPAYERYVHEAREHGSEEYLDSEKYEVRHWPETDDDMTELIAAINRIRRENPALQQNATLKFHETDNEQLLCYSKSAGDNVIVVVVNLDSRNAHTGWIDLDLAPLQLDPERTYQVHDLLSNARHSWHGGRNYVQLNPHVIPAHIFKIRRRVRTERDFEYFL